MDRRILFGVLFLAGILLGAFFVLGTLNPQIGRAVGSGILWVVLTVGAALVSVVAGSILWAMRSMYTGYLPGEATTRSMPEGSDRVSALLPVAQPDKDPEMIAPYEDILLELCRAECALANVGTSADLRGLTQKQQRRYHHALKEVEALVREVSKEGLREKAAS